MMLAITKSMIQATQGLGNACMVRKKSIIAFIGRPSCQRSPSPRTYFRGVNSVAERQWTS